MTDGAGSQAWSYDSMGRVWTDQRTTNNVAHTFDYTYNYDGSLGSVAYPSGRTVSYLYNTAARLLSAADSSNTYAQSAVYYAPGELDTLTVGQSGSYNIGVSQTFNSRLQPVNFNITTPGGSVMNLTYNFDLGTSDNGNVMSATNNRDNTRNQTFTYDSLNRLASSLTAATSGANCWGMAFNIDAWGNLYSNTALSGYANCAQTLLSLGVNGNNQITNSGFRYDAAGNTLADGLYNYTYDAEGHQISAAGVNYIYDGDGQRVEKANGTIYWYGTGGEVLTESALDGSSPVDYIYFGGRRLARVTSSAVYYYFGDHLDSARVVVQAGANASCYEGDFEPYGREHVVTGTCSQHYKFTGKERDTETQNDYFPARFLENNLGRWLSPDPGGVNAVHLEDPQTWNMYAYVRNNPITLTDPTGLAEQNPLETYPSSLLNASCKKEPGLCMRGTDDPGPETAGNPVISQDEANYLRANNLCPGRCDGLSYSADGLTYTWVPAAQVGVKIEGSGTTWGAVSPGRWEVSDAAAIGSVAIAGAELGPADIAVIGAAAATILLYKNKDAIKHIVSQLDNAADHINNLMISPDQDPRNTWRGQIRAFLKDARKWGNRMSPGKLQDFYMKMIDAAEAAVPQD